MSVSYTHLGKVRKQINPKLQVGGILFTMVDAHTNDARNNMELLRNVYGSQIPVSYTHLDVYKRQP